MVSQTPRFDSGNRVLIGRAGAGMRMRAALILLVVAGLVGGQVLRGEEIAPGVSYSYYEAPGPNRVYVVRADRVRSEYKLKVGWPQKKRNFTARQTVSKIASLYDAPPAHDVLAAVNASFFGTAPAITGAAGSDGEMLAPPSGANETFLFGPTRLPVIREDVSHVNGRLTFADATYSALHGYNQARPADTVVAYTPQWSATTGTAEQGIEVVLANVSYPMRAHKEISGIVTAVRTGAASVNNGIPAGGLVISAIGAPASTIAAKVQVGQRLFMLFETSDSHCNNADMSITGIGWLLAGGVTNTGNWGQYGFATERHPRTVLAWNDTYIFMMVCDGRCPGSVGMTFQELVDFLAGTLGATDAVNLDGGGSSTMWVNGQVRNVPSDYCGTERAVGNSVLLVRQETATAFPFEDAFANSGRLSGWDDKFRYNPIQAFSPLSPGGEGYVLNVRNPDGGVETVRRGDFGDANYAVEADIYCEYRPNVAANGYERCCLFARDSGTGALGLAGNYGPGNCYALTFDSNDGRVRAGKYVNGAISDFRESNRIFMASTAWRRFRIECVETAIRYRVDGAAIAEVTDFSHPRGYFGIGYHEFFNDNANIHGTRADNFSASTQVSPGPASEPQPTDGATGVPLTANLGWTAGTNAASHSVYFGTISPGEFRVNQAGTTFRPGPLALNRTYFWRVDELNQYGTTTGKVWSFRAQRYRGDFDDDADVDQEDFGRFQACLTGVAVQQTDPACARARLEPLGNPDGDIDEVDLGIFIQCLSGPGVQPSSDCIE